MLSPEQLAQMTASGEDNFSGALGIVFDSASVDRVTGHIDIGPQHHQPFGVVHGGVWCSVVEEFGSMGAALTAIPAGKGALGVSNTTDFLRPVREGRVEVVATAVHQGRTQHLWQVEITRADGKLVARGQVRVQIVAPREETA